MEEPDYWSSSDGIFFRLDMLTDAVETETFNEAVKVVGNTLGIKKFRVAGPLDFKMCYWCADHLDKVYTSGQFMPQLPKHPHCRHYWDVMLSEPLFKPKE